MANETKMIMRELRGIKQNIATLRKHVVDVDILVTDDDLESIKKAERDFKEGNTKRLS